MVIRPLLAITELAGLCLILCTVKALVRYLKRSRSWLTSLPAGLDARFWVGEIPVLTSTFEVCPVYMRTVPEAFLQLNMFLLLLK